MKKILIALLMAGCATDHTVPSPTWRDAAQEIAYGQCSRWIECGTLTDQTWQECVDDLVYDFCDHLADATNWKIRCFDAYDGDFDEVSRCSMWYEQVTCGQWVEPCVL